MTATTVQAGQTLTGLIVGNGDSLTVQSGGTAVATVIQSGGNVSILNGGLALSSNVEGTGGGFAQLSVNHGGVANGTTLNASGNGFSILNVAPGATATNTVVSGSGFNQIHADVSDNLSGTVLGDGTEFLDVSSGETLQAQNLAAGVIVNIETGAAISPGIQLNGAWLEPESGVRVPDVTIDSGLVLLAQNDVANGTTVVGGSLQIMNGAEADNTVVESGTFQVNGIAKQTILRNGAFQLVMLGGTAIGTTVESGGNITVQPGGTVTALGLASGSTALLGNVAYAADKTAILDPTTDILTIADALSSNTIQLSGDYTDATFSLSNGGPLGTDLSVSGGNVTAPTPAAPSDPALTINGNDNTVTSTAPGSIITITGTGNIIHDTGSAASITSIVSGNTIISASGATVLTTLPAVIDTTTGQPVSAPWQNYSGPVAGLQDEYISTSNDNLNVSANTNNWFIHTGAGEDAIAVSGGTNVLDGGTGSNFLVGTASGAGTDTFFVDNRSPSASIWSTVVNFHAGDAATVWGVTPLDFNLAWSDNQGAAGYTGLTLHATKAGVPAASLTLAGFSSADLSNGKLSVTYGTVGGNAYMYVQDLR